MVLRLAMAKLNQIIPGAVFRHYKGQEYKIVTLAKNESNEEDVVVYEALYGDHKIWVRRLESFCDDVTVDNVGRERFSLQQG